MTLVALLLLIPSIKAQAPPNLPDADRTRLAEGFRLADALGNKVWPDWDKVPFVVLLVTKEHEFLVRHPKPSDDFALVGEDAVLKSKVWYRKRQYPTGLLATFPAVGGVSTVVIGQAESTESKSSSRWVITLLHEHFHQLQEAQPRYYADVDALQLARGDKTGMWMLNYPFPYTAPEVKDHFTMMRNALAEALAARPQADFANKFAAYVEARKEFRSQLKADEYKYFAFQIWKEGIARYTEQHLADLAALKYQPSKEFLELRDYKSFQEVAREIRSGVEKDLGAVQLEKAKREVVYNVGAAEGLVLDRAKPGWRKLYFEEKLSLDSHFASEK
jgi:hypothetical protein